MDWSAWQAWRDWPQRAARLWRRSLQLRTVAITIALSSLAIVVASGYMSYVIGNDLFDSRRQQVLAEAQSASAQAQTILDATEATDEAALTSVMSQVRLTVAKLAPSSGGLISIVRTPGQSTGVVLQNSFSPDIRSGVISDELRSQVADGTQPQYWQSAAITTDDGVSPAIVAGSVLLVPAAGRYELYMVFDLRDTAETLAFVQTTLFWGGAALVLLVAAVTWIIVRFVVAPIRLAAETSRRIAEGQLAVRIPIHGDDEIATLARSFNAMADSLEDQITQLADLSRVQQRFVSDVSHELRTPLTTIRLAGDVLYDKRANFDPASARSAELLRNQIQRFEELLADLLEISRYDALAVELETEPVNLVHLVEECIDGVRSLAEEAGSELRFAPLGGYVEPELDPRRIRRIVSNLLGNAIEHGEGRPIVIEVDSNETAVAVSVRDYGLGMTAEQSARVFDRFWRADPSRHRKTGGTGLGLAISREDAVLHGGRLEVWSAPGAGALFRLTLPRQPGAVAGNSPLALVPADAEAADA